MKLSIVTTLYFSEKYLSEFCKRIIKSIPNDFDQFEIILVNDGSPDDSLNVALNLKKQIPQIKIINLARNFGHHKAIVTGLEYVTGEYVFLIDSDLEERPELLNNFWNEISNNKEIDVVYGVQDKRKGSVIEKYSGSIFYFIYNKLVVNEFKVTNNLSTIRLMSKKYVNEFVKYKPNNYYLAPIFNYMGFNQVKYLFEKKSSSPTTYNFINKLNLLVNVIISFSTKPLFFLFYLGILITIVSFFIGLYYIILNFTGEINLDGWTSLIVSIYFLCGIIITFIGLISIYLTKVISEISGKPFSVIKNIYD